MDDIIQEKEVLKEYFQTGDKPTEIQYRNLIHSLRHKHDKIGLQDLNLQGYDEEGERDNSLIVRLGDFVDSSNGTKIVITDDDQEIQISGRLVTDSDINAFGQTIAAGSVVVDNTLNIDGTGNFSGTLNSNGNLNVRGDYLALKMNEDRHNAYMNIWQRLSANDITFRYIDNGDGLGNVDSLRLKRSGEAIFPTDVIANRFVGDGSQLTNLPTQAPVNTAYTDSDNNFSSAQTIDSGTTNTALSLNSSDNTVIMSMSDDSTTMLTAIGAVGDKLRLYTGDAARYEIDIDGNHNFKSGKATFGSTIQFDFDGGNTRPLLKRNGTSGGLTINTEGTVASSSSLFRVLNDGNLRFNINGNGTSTFYDSLRIESDDSNSPLLKLTGTKTNSNNDVYMSYDRDNGGGGWSTGIDSSDNYFKIARSSSLINSNVAFEIDTDGNHDFKTGTATFGNKATFHEVIEVGKSTHSELRLLREGHNYIAATKSSGRLTFRAGGSIDRYIIDSDGNHDFKTGTATFGSNITLNQPTEAWDNAFNIVGTVPRIKFTDTNTNTSDFWIGANQDSFYILTDRDGDGTQDGTATTPLWLHNDTSLGYVYGDVIATQPWVENHLSSQTLPSIKVEDTLKLGSSTGTNALNSGTLDFLEDIDHNFGGADGHGFRLTYNGDGNLFELKGGNRTITNTIFSVSRDDGEFNFYRDLRLNEGHENITSHWYKRSIYNATNGILIETDVDVASNKMIELIIEGNSYTNRNISGPITSRVQAYNYTSAGTIINSGALTNDPNFTIDVFHYNGKVYFWFEQTNTFQTYSFKTNAGVGSSPVKIVNVTNAAKPTSGVTNNVTITPIQILTSASISFEDIPDRPIWNWGTDRTDITGLTTGSTFGTILESANYGHIGIGIRGNDPGDSFWIFESEDDVDATSTYTKTIMRVNDSYFQYKGNDVVHTGNIISTLQNSFITISSDQTITGQKTFTGTTNMHIIHYDRAYMNGYSSGSPVIGLKGKDVSQSFFIAEQNDSTVRMMDMVETANGAYQRWYNDGVETIRINGESGSVDTQNLEVSGTTHLQGNTLIHTNNSESGALVLQRHFTSVSGDDVARLWVDDMGLNFLLDNDNDSDTGIYSFYKKISGVNNLMFRVGTHSIEAHLPVNATGQTITAGNFAGDGSQLTNLPVQAPTNVAYIDSDNNFSEAQTFENYLHVRGATSGGSIGFNRNTDNGDILNPAYGAFQLQTSSDGRLQIQRYSSSGTSLGDALSINLSDATTKFGGDLDATMHTITGSTFEFPLAGGTITTNLKRNGASGGMIMDTNSPVGSSTDLLAIRSGSNDQFLVKGNGAGWFAGDVIASNTIKVSRSEPLSGQSAAIHLETENTASSNTVSTYLNAIHYDTDDSGFYIQTTTNGALVNRLNITPTQFVFSDGDIQVGTGNVLATDFIGNWNGKTETDYVRATGNVSETITGHKTFDDSLTLNLSLIHI